MHVPTRQAYPPLLAIVLNSLGSGGAERAMVNLAGALAARGERVALVIVRPDGPLRALIAPEVEVVDLHAHRVVAALPALVRWIRLRHPHAMLSACANSNVVAVAAARAAGTGTRTVICEQTTLSQVARDT